MRTMNQINEKGFPVVTTAIQPASTSSDGAHRVEIPLTPRSASRLLCSSHPSKPKPTKAIKKPTQIHGSSLRTLGQCACMKFDLSQRYSAAGILLDFLHGCKHTSRDSGTNLGLLVKHLGCAQ